MMIVSCSSSCRPVLFSLIAGLAFALVVSSAPLAAEDPVLEAMGLEIERSLQALGAPDAADAPYFIGIEIVDTDTFTVSAEDGGLHDDRSWTMRWADVDLRLGSPALDSSHALRDPRAVSGRYQSSGARLPQTDDVGQLRHALWREIDARCKAARKRWGKVQAEAQVMVEEDQAEDLSPSAPVVFLGPREELRTQVESWREAARRTSAAFSSSPSVLESSVSYNASVETRWLANSEGTRLRHSLAHYRTDLTASVRADDGADLNLYRSWVAHESSGLPPPAELEKTAIQLAAKLDKLLEAPRQGPYHGPVLLSGRSAAVFFHEVFGHRTEGERLKRIDDAQTFRGRIGDPILPAFLSVHDDPTMASAVGVDLNGHYQYDSEGVPAQRVTLVEEGVLKGFLQSRSPVAAGQKSNGHGRRSWGRRVGTRQGNLVISATKTHDEEELRSRLRALAAKAGLEYGLYVDEISGGFTMTGRTMPNAFNVLALSASRVFVDGRPDELVRGVDLIGTPLEAFGSVVAAGDRQAVFNGSCGSESGWVPVSAVAPSLLLRGLETQRKQRGQETPPLLPAPTPDPESVESEAKS